MDRRNGNREHYDGGIFLQRRCSCGFRAVRFTSWTDDNPGRRFIRCPEFGGKKCWLWEWIDPVMCDRSKQIIPGLLRRLNQLENRLEERNLDNEGLRLLLVQFSSEVEELKEKILEYDSAVQSATTKGRKYIILCIVLFAVLVCVLLS